MLTTDSVRLGLSLWSHLHVALAVETLLLAGGWRLYFGATQAESLVGRYGLRLFLVILTAFAFGGQLWAPPPASVRQLAASSVVTLVIVFVVAAWLDRKRRMV